MSERKGYSRIFRKLVVVIPFLVVTALIAGCSTGFVSEGKDEVSIASSPVASSHNPTNRLVQSNTEGSVTIDVEWMGEEKDSLVFDVSMNTHSVDLDQYDLRELAVLRDNEGNEYSTTSWDSAPGGHHRKGTLTFPIPDSLSQGKAKYVEIVIRDVAGIEGRVLKWEL